MAEPETVTGDVLDPVADGDPAPAPEAPAAVTDQANHDHPGAPAVASTDLARRVSNEVIRPLDADSVISAMQEHQALLARLLDPSDWQGRPGGDKSFVKKSGWRKIATAYNLSMQQVHPDHVERGPADDPDWPGGKPLRATATWRCVAPNGRGWEADGHCAFHESRFSSDKGNVTKLENDLRATAETRAKNRAISDLVGMGKVSAEEVDANAAQVADAATIKQLPPAMGAAFGDTATAKACYDRLVGMDRGQLTEQSAQAVLMVLGALNDHRSGAAAAAPGDGQTTATTKEKA